MELPIQIFTLSTIMSTEGGTIKNGTAHYKMVLNIDTSDTSGRLLGPV